MRIIISPAKKMNVDTDTLECTGLPRFVSDAGDLMLRLKSMSPKELQALWNCNDTIAALNVERLRTMDLRTRLTPAILAFEGLQYQHMAPRVFEHTHFDYIQKRLRILSGFYGLLRPLDGVVPHRLEMQAKLAVRGRKNLYEFWGDKIARQVASETDLVLNLASKEYSKVIERHLPRELRFVQCVFGQVRSGKVVQKGTLCKMARGSMVRFLAENQISGLDDIKEFRGLDYRYSPQISSRNSLVFITPLRRAEQSRKPIT